jgi:hypothetical protein
MAKNAGPKRDISNLQTLLASLIEQTKGDRVTIEDLLNAVGRRAFGPILIVLGFIAIGPLTIVPGTSWLVALVTLLFAAQVALGQSRPWLPKKALTASFPREMLVRGVNTMSRPARFIDRFVKPRIGVLTDPPFVQLVAIAAMFAALISFPLGLVPFGPVLPGLAIMLIGLGLTARDGVILLLAGGTMAGALVFVGRLVDRLF